jgi:hypothetical protein
MHPGSPSTTPRRSRQTLNRTVLALVVATALGVLAPLPVDADRASAGKAARQPLRLIFNEAIATGSPFATLANAGSARLRVHVTTEYDGTLTRGRGRTGGRNGAVRTPHHDPSGNAPRAVIRVVDARGRDNLDPGNDAFTFGADIRLDRVSEDLDTGSYDNGDNVVQRGLFGARSQYKLQVDHQRATCRVRGSAGTVAVTSKQVIRPRTWYRLRCTRTDDAVVISVTSWDDAGTPSTLSTSLRGVTGSLATDSQSLPLTVGGKLTSAGDFVPSTDQFNGLVDNVILRIS